MGGVERRANKKSPGQRGTLEDYPHHHLAYSPAHEGIKGLLGQVFWLGGSSYSPRLPSRPVIRLVNRLSRQETKRVTLHEQ